MHISLYVRRLWYALLDDYTMLCLAGFFGRYQICCEYAPPAFTCVPMNCSIVPFDMQPLIAVRAPATDRFISLAISLVVRQPGPVGVLAGVADSSANDSQRLP